MHAFWRKQEEIQRDAQILVRASSDPEPAWWLNLQANPDTTVELPAGRRAVHGRAATPEERPRLWARWGDYDGEEELASWASRRSRETAVVILEPRNAG